MDKKKKTQIKWSDSQIFDYERFKDQKSNKSHLEKRKESIEKGEIECSEWWLCWRKH